MAWHVIAGAEKDTQKPASDSHSLTNKIRGNPTQTIVCEQFSLNPATTGTDGQIVGPVGFEPTTKGL